MTAEKVKIRCRQSRELDGAEAIPVTDAEQTSGPVNVGRIPRSLVAEGDVRRQAVAANRRAAGNAT
jgi:hypothetical protein